MSTLLLAGAFSLVGCGGGGGTSVTLASKSLLQYSSASNSLSFGYVLTSLTQTVGGTQVGTGSTGIRQIAIAPVTNGGTPVTINGQTELKLTTSDSGSLGGSSNYGDSYVTNFTQDSTGVLTVQGYFSGLSGDSTKTASAPYAFTPADFSSTTQISGSSALTPSGTLGISFTPGSIENVTVPLGTYATVKVTASVTYSDPTAGTVTRAGTYWYAPQLGTYVQFDETVTQGNTVTELKGQLSSKNP